MWPLKTVSIELILTLLVSEEIKNFQSNSIAFVQAYVVSPSQGGNYLDRQDKNEGFNGLSKEEESLERDPLLAESSLEAPGQSFPPDLWTLNEEYGPPPLEHSPHVPIPGERPKIYPAPVIPHHVTHLEKAGEKVSNFLTHIGDGILRHTGKVNSTLVHLHNGIEHGAISIQRFLATAQQRKTDFIRSVLDRISNFFHNALGRIHQIFGGLALGFHNLLQGLFNRDKNPWGGIRWAKRDAAEENEILGSSSSDSKGNLTVPLF